jgi:hypothetical protein
MIIKNILHHQRASEKEKKRRQEERMRERYISTLYVLSIKNYKS